jgi:SAM-dependent methyltransferase
MTVNDPMASGMQHHIQLNTTSSQLQLGLLDTSHMPSYPTVYPPCHGTALLMAALTTDAPVLRRHTQCFLDLGCGCGAVAAHAARLLKSAAIFASDINHDALKATAVTCTRNATSLVHLMRADLLEAFRPHSIDVAAFHVPYVPTSAEQLEMAAVRADFSAAWAGGPRGQAVLKRVLPTLKRVLTATGTLYVVWYEPFLGAELTGTVDGMRTELCAEFECARANVFPPVMSAVVHSALRSHSADRPMFPRDMIVCPVLAQHRRSTCTCCAVPLAAARPRVSSMVYSIIGSEHGGSSHDSMAMGHQPSTELIARINAF